MSSQITNPTKVSPLALMAARFNSDPNKLLDTLKGTVFAAARNNEELMALVIVANEYKLNPLTKEIYAFPAKGGGIVPVISIDGWANLANSHPMMDGMDFEWHHDGNGALVSCTCIIFRKDRSRPIKVTEYLEECRRNTDPWKMVHRMLRHKALSQCVRIAFGFSGVYDEDEAVAISPTRDVTPVNPQTSALFRNSPALPQETAAPVVAEDGSGTQGAAELFPDTPPVSLPALIRDKMAKEGLQWQQVNAVLVSGGVINEDVASVDDLADDILHGIIKDWNQISELAKRKK